MVRIKIEGMSCQHCKGSVERALSAVPGLSNVVEVSVERGEAVLEGQAEAEAMVKAIVDAGFKAEVMP